MSAFYQFMWVSSKPLKSSFPQATPPRPGSNQIFPLHAKYHHLASPDNKPRQMSVMSPRRCTQPDPIANCSVINREISISLLASFFRTIRVRKVKKCGNNAVQMESINELMWRVNTETLINFKITRSSRN